MKLFNKKITSRKHSPNDKHYHAVVDVKRGLKASDSLSFMTSDIHTGVLTLELIDGDLPYNVIGCKVSATISCPDSTVLEIPCEMLDDNIVEIHLGIEGTYQEGTYTFDLKIDRGNARIVGIPTITYTVLSSIVEKSVDDDKFQILDKLISQTKDRLDRFDVAMSGMTSDSEVREARDGENLLYDRLKRDLDYSKSINAKVEQVAESVTELESNVGNIVQPNLTQLDNRITQVDNRVTQEVNTINSSIADLNLKVDHMGDMSGSAGATTSYVKILSERDWLQEDGLYYVDINHTLLTEMVMVSMIDIDSGDSIASTFRVLSNDMVRVISNYPCKASVSIINSNVEVKGANFAQIDDELVSPYRTWSSEKIDNELGALEFVASNIKMNDDSSVEDAINTNKTNISSLQTKVDNGQVHKLTWDGGNSIFIDSGTFDDIKTTGIYTCTHNVGGTKPVPSYNGYYHLEVIGADSHLGQNNKWITQRATVFEGIGHGIQVYTRVCQNGTWTHWGRNIVDGQSTKMTADHGACINISNGDANDISTTGFFMGNNVANVPITGWVYIESLVHNALYQVQKATDLHESSKRWTRHQTGGAWSSWREL